MNKGFRIWLEAEESNKPIVFIDLDETLVHRIEVGWLKDSPQNKEYAKILVPGQPPYKSVKMIQDDGEDKHIFPRPGVINFLKEINKFADIHCLTHHGGNYADRVVKVMDFSPYIKEVFKTGKQKPGSLGKQFDLENRPWVLVDNMVIDSIEMINKFRILGLNYPDLKPRKEADKILVKSREHFVKVKDWIPTADEYDDYELWRIIPKIKFMLGIEKQQL